MVRASRVIVCPNAPFTRRVGRYAIASCIVLWGIALNIAQDVVGEELLSLRKVAEPGDSAPGFEEQGLLFSAFGAIPAGEPFGDPPPAIDNAGSVTFHAFADEDGIPNDQFPFGERGLFREVGGQLKLIVKPGDPAPPFNFAFAGFPGTDSFPLAATPEMHDGKVTFLATTADRTDLFGVWTDRFGALEFLLRSQDSLPGSPPGHEVTDFVFVQRGHSILVNALTASASGNAEGLWRNRTGDFEVLATDGLPAPGTEPGVFFGEGTSLAFFGSVDRWDANVNGDVIFNAYLDSMDPACGNGICESAAGEDCDSCPDDCRGVLSGNPSQRFCCGDGSGQNGVDCSDPRCSEAGFQCTDALPPTIHENNDEGIWADGPGGLQLLLREGDPAPQAGAGVFYGSGGNGELGGLTTFGDEDDIPVRNNDNGALLFGARITSPDFYAKSSIWTTRNGSLELIFAGSRSLPEKPGGPVNPHPGDPAPGLEHLNGTFRTFLFGDLGNANQIAFIATAVLDGDPLNNTIGIWWDLPGEMSLIAAVNEPVPGVDGAVFLQLSYAVNVNPNWEHVLFLGRYAGPAVPDTTSLFRANPDGSLDEMLKPGGEVLIDGEELRTVASFTLGAGQSDAEERAFEINFTDGSSGVFVASFASIPQRLGDLNCDGRVNGLDVGPFITAVLDPGGYPIQFPACNIDNGDMNGDSVVDDLDIQPLAACLAASCP
ncbi:MAG TPA: choice-of-anchor tandem repeat NxxGxxAF-containing protein [Phycisphaerae bacterium]|nr:choice-of-anchor tandem repeat NxxGxxAF-containing protein [Phycisphaerae bacterium]